MIRIYCIIIYLLIKVPYKKIKQHSHEFLGQPESCLPVEGLGGVEHESQHEQGEEEGHGVHGDVEVGGVDEAEEAEGPYHSCGKGADCTLTGYI